VVPFPAKNARLFLSAFPMFVPRLSWQTDRFRMEVAIKKGGGGRTGQRLARIEGDDVVKHRCGRRWRRRLTCWRWWWRFAVLASGTEIRENVVAVYHVRGRFEVPAPANISVKTAEISAIRVS
jgi:hypothetical protein